MNIRFEINKLGNEDVIATSGAEFCTNHSRHYYIYGAYSSSLYPAYEYFYEDGEWWYDPKGVCTCPTDSLEQGKYYVKDGGGNYVECTENHDTSNLQS